MATMERIGKVVVNAIVHRTFTAMKGVDDQALPTHSQLKSKGLVRGPSSDGGVYSKSHGKRRSEGGWPTNKVTLSMTDRMSNDVDVVSKLKTIVRISVKGPSKAYAFYTNRLRPWFGISDKDRAGIRKEVSRILKEVGRRG